MESQEVFLTNDGLQKALNQLEFLRTSGRAKVAQYLHEAQEAGDVIDNAAYEDAKNEQARLEGRIIELEQLLAKAKVIDRVQSDVVTLGSIVRLAISDGREVEYTIVGAFEADPSAKRISNESPVGKALMGRKRGDEVAFSTPKGERRLKITKIDVG